MKKFSLVLLAWTSFAIAQEPDWFSKMQNNTGNFYEITIQAETYFKERVDGTTSRISSDEQYFKQFAKWQKFWKTRVRNTESVQGDMMYLNDAMAM